MSGRDLENAIDLFETFGPEECLELLHQYFNGPMSWATERRTKEANSGPFHLVDPSATSLETGSPIEPKRVGTEHPLLGLDFDRALSRGSRRSR